jgi:circadian clock protein KaiC
MVLNDASAHGPGLRRLPTRVPGLDAVLDGGLMVGDTYLIAGTPGTGKTTLGNQLAFAHAAAGASVLFATLLTESHDRMLAHLEGFHFFDRALVGERIRYLSLLGVLQEEGIEGVMHVVLRTVRSHQSSLLIIDGAGVARMLTGSDFDYARFIHGLQARTALLGCTTLLLAGEREADPVATHVDGVILLTNEPVQARDARWLRVMKLRGSDYLNGRHRFAIGDPGVTVFPRLEAAHARTEPAWHEPDERLTLGVPGLDAMTGGGLPAGSATVVLGTPGAGKTLLGLHFLAEGARRGESGLIATFHETAAGLASTAERAGMDLSSYLDRELIRVLWRPPLELAPDEWAWQLLDIIDQHRPRRLVIDAFSDLLPLFAMPERRAFFTPALAQKLRDRGVTALINVEIDTFAAPELISPVQNVSASVDNAILLRTLELGSSLRRVVSILKERQTGFDPTIREFAIGSQGMVIGDPLDATGLLTGSATPLSDNV